MKKIVSILLMLCVYFNTVSALECYTCDSKNTKACDDPFDKELLQTTTCPNSESQNLLNNIFSIDTSKSDVTQSMLRKLTAHFAGNSSGNLVPKASAVCVKIEASYNDDSVILRSCTAQSSRFCELMENELENVGVSMDFCETCSTDQCNLAPSSGHLAPLLLLAVPIVRRMLF